MSTVIVLFLFATAFTIVRGREYWPYSPYPMFSSVEEPTHLSRFRVYGEPVEEQLQTVELSCREHIAPFHYIRLNSAIRVAQENSSGREAMASVAAGLFRRYERRREAGEHDGPALQSLRIVRVTWPLLPDAGNVDQPERVELVADVDGTAFDGVVR